MSRGLGKYQRAALDIIRHRGKPLTFAQLFDGDDTPDDDDPRRLSDIRSARRAIHKLVEDGMLMAIGSGGRGDPFRYFFHPLGLALMCKDKADYDALWNALQADPGAEEAMRRLPQPKPTEPPA